MELKDSHHNQACPTDLQDRICEGACNIIGNIYINKFAMSVCLSVCLSRYAFGRASTYGAETWHGGRVWQAGGNRQLFVATRQVKGHPEVKSSRNALWLPNLVSRTPDHSVLHCWGQRSCRGHLGSARGQIT